MALTTSKLRENIFKILDQVIETGLPVEVERRGKLLKIVPAGRNRGKLESLMERPGYMWDDPEAYVHMDWSKKWQR